MDADGEDLDVKNDDDDDDDCVSPKSEAPDSPKATSDESVMSSKDTGDREPGGLGVAAGGTPAATAPPVANELHIYPWMRRVHSGHGRAKRLKFSLLKNIACI